MNRHQDDVTPRIACSRSRLLFWPAPALCTKAILIAAVAVLPAACATSSPVAAPPPSATPTVSSPEVSTTPSLLASVVAAVATSITSPDSDSSSSGSNPGCFLTAAQASAAVGSVKYLATQVTDPGSCEYLGSQGGDLGVITLVTDTADDQAFTLFRQTLGGDDGRSAKPITGVGERAAAEGDEMLVQIGTRIFLIAGADAPTPGGDLPHTIALAKALATPNG